ncbi:hypothetical protein KV692_05475 [Xanthomonas euvesicatoria pv. physalidis]|uniref:hypothetical protein n=1 Tax=Xanthomonas euvesicatoria TaxID=456327 RepID=UPI001C4750FC|nr:hypothetical protein [Xanthomonas euvesicatoria]MBV6687343.1 hypothetical protein [Xanthomonas euvesicatoria pv. physalidis]
MNEQIKITLLGGLPDGKVLFEIDRHLSREEYELLRESLQRGLDSPATAVVLPPGVRMSINPAQLDRIEQKLDALLDALADDVEEAEEPARTLDGELSGGGRDQSMSLD